MTTHRGASRECAGDQDFGADSRKSANRSADSLVRPNSSRCHKTRGQGCPRSVLESTWTIRPGWAAVISPPRRRRKRAALLHGRAGGQQARGKISHQTGPIQESVAADVRRLCSIGFCEVSLFTSAATIPLFLQSKLHARISFHYPLDFCKLGE